MLHLDSAARMRNGKLEDSSYRVGDPSTVQRRREADRELACVTGIIVESVVDSAIEPKAWLENELLAWEDRSPLRPLRALTALPFSRMLSSSSW